MTASQPPIELRWDPPGPGSWNNDPVHFPRPVTRYWAEMHPEPFQRGTRDFMAYYGTVLDGLESRYVNGFAYNQMQPVADEEIPQRFARAEEVFPQKVWREQLREWDETAKPAAMAKHREIQAVDPDALSDDELAAYLRRCAEHHAAMITQHMRFTASAIIPTGRLPRARRPMDREVAGRAARSDAGRGAGVGGQLRRAGGAHRGDPQRRGRAAIARVRRRSRGGVRRAARAPRGDRGSCERVPRPRRVPAARRLRHLRSRRARAPRRAAARDSDRHVGGGWRGVRRRGGDGRHPQPGPRGAPRRVRRAAR